MDPFRPIRYGEFPRMFEGFPPNEEVDLYDFRTMAAILRHAPEEVKWQLVDPEVLDRRLEEATARDEGRELYRRVSMQQDARQGQGPSGHGPDGGKGPSVESLLDR